MEFYEVVKTRRSIRKYRPDPIPDAVLERVLEAARVAPWGEGGSKYPPTRLVLLRDSNDKEKAVALCNGQAFVATAPLLVVACAPMTVNFNRGGWMGDYSVIVDVSIAFTHLILAAREEGLGTCWLGSFNNTAFKEFLGLPGNYNVVAATPLGYPEGDRFMDSQDQRRPALEEFIRWDRWRD